MYRISGLTKLVGTGLVLGTAVGVPNAGNAASGPSDAVRVLTIQEMNGTRGGAKVDITQPSSDPQVASTDNPKLRFDITEADLDETSFKVLADGNKIDFATYDTSSGSAVYKRRLADWPLGDHNHALDIDVCWPDDPDNCEDPNAGSDAQRDMKIGSAVRVLNVEFWRMTDGNWTSPHELVESKEFVDLKKAGDEPDEGLAPTDVYDYTSQRPPGADALMVRCEGPEGWQMRFNESHSPQTITSVEESGENCIDIRFTESSETQGPNEQCDDFKTTFNKIADEEDVASGFVAERAMNVFYVRSIARYEPATGTYAESFAGWAPASGQGNNVIAVDGTNSSGNARSNKAMAFLLAHEWGHTVGLQHAEELSWGDCGESQNKRNFMCSTGIGWEVKNNADQCEGNMYDNSTYYDFNNSTRH